MVAGFQLYKKVDLKKKKVLVEKLHYSTATVSETIFDVHHQLILGFSQYQSDLLVVFAS